MWAVDWLAERWPKTASVVIDAQSPAMSLLPELKKAHVKVTVTNMQEMGRACGRFLDMLKAGTLKHPRDEYQPQLAAAVHDEATSGKTTDHRRNLNERHPDNGSAGRVETYGRSRNGAETRRTDAHRRTLR